MKRCLGRKCRWGSQGKAHKSAQSPGWKEGSSCGQLLERRKDFHTEVLLLASQQGAMWAGHNPYQKRQASSLGLGGGTHTAKVRKHANKRKSVVLFLVSSPRDPGVSCTNTNNTSPQRREA